MTKENTDTSAGTSGSNIDPQPDTPAPTEAEPSINLGAISTYKIEPLKEGNWIAWQSHMVTMLK